MHLATCGAGLAPGGARVWAVSVDEDRTHITAFVPREAAGRILPDLEENGRAALVFGRPTDDRACQIKGAFAGARPAAPREKALVLRQVERFCADLDAIGMPAAVSAAWKTWPCTAIRIRVAEVFNQTPGPGAGERIR